MTIAGVAGHTRSSVEHARAAARARAAGGGMHVDR